MRKNVFVRIERERERKPRCFSLFFHIALAYFAELLFVVYNIFAQNSICFICLNETIGRREKELMTEEFFVDKLGVILAIKSLLFGYFKLIDDCKGCD